MTVTTSRPTSRFHWVPAAAGWIIGVIATLSLLSSVSPLLRHIIKVPREFINDYLFNFPDTSFAWAFVLALLAAALAARKRIAWWVLLIYLVAEIVWNVGDLLTGGESALQDAGELIGLVVHVVLIVLLLLARNEFWARVRRAALFKAAAVLIVGMTTGTLIGWCLVELFPGSLAREDRFLYTVNRVNAFSGAGPEQFSGHPHILINVLLGLFGALALMAAGKVDHPAVQRGIAYLIQFQGKDGLWTEPQYTGGGFPRVFYLRYHGYSKFFPLWALARYRNLRNTNSRFVGIGM